VEIRLRSGARTVTVGVVRDGDDCTAIVDGTTHRVAILAVGPHTSIGGGAVVEALALEIDGRPWRALVARERARLLVSLAGQVFAFETGEAAAGGHETVGSGTVTAPMPGKIVSVLVAEGDAVVVGQPLVVLEAMKMETTLAAEVAGRVRAVRSVAGAAVAAGDVLVEIADAAAPPDDPLPAS
jgi:3-methylcrotonyl-CoA carboxylase alpha subunit